MIRTTVKLDDETIEALKTLTEKHQDLREALQQSAQAAYFTYLYHRSQLFPRFPISHPYKRGGWKINP